MDWWLGDFSDSVYMADGYRCEDFEAQDKHFALTVKNFLFFVFFKKDF